MNENYAELMPTFPLFKGFTVNGARRLLDSGEVKQHEAGAVLLKEGDPADFVLLVLTGRLEVFVDREGEHLILTEAEPGDILGELAVLCGIPRSASVRAKNTAAVLEWSDEAFRTLAAARPIIVAKDFPRGTAHARRERAVPDRLGDRRAAGSA